MRLLDVDNYTITKREHLKKRGKLRQNGKFAIVSHRWTDNEITSEDYKTRQRNGGLGRLDRPQDINQDTDPGLAKIAWACYLAKRDSIPYIWIDTCCVDSGPSADVRERSQAINSMFRWYREAEVCYAFLLDVSDNVNEHQQGRIGSFENSDWFTRGWTLQELLAPRNLRFYDCQFRQIGTKGSRPAEIYSATGIALNYLCGNFDGACIAVKMSWLAGRSTEYRDDMAYCMLGIFGIQMDVRYGEEEDAFLRLQEQLVEKVEDESIFAWTIEEQLLSATDSRRSFGLLAPWPSCFRDSGNLTIDCPKLHRPRNGIGYTVARQGIQFEIPGRLPDHGNGVEWNSRTANRRTNYDLGLNCWVKGNESKGSVTLHLWKDEKGRWRRTNTEHMILDNKLRKSFKFTFPKTRPYWIPHKTSAEDDWGRILADLSEEQIQDARNGQ